MSHAESSATPTPYKVTEDPKMQLRAEEISNIIKRQIQNYEKATVTTETGTVLSVGDGIARVYGLEGAMAGELLEFPGNLMGLVLTHAPRQPRSRLIFNVRQSSETPR